MLEERRRIRWDFHIKYKKIEDIVPGTLFEYLAIVTFLSPMYRVISHGEGISHEKAMNNAAFNMLQALELVSKNKNLLKF